MEEQRVRIADIAEELGLSTATVSNVIHGKLKKVSAETVKRVQNLLEERQYIPSMAGILLAQNDSRIVGVVIHDHDKYEGHTMEDNFIAASVNALSQELDREGYFLMLKLTQDVQEIPRFASMWNMVGVIMIGFCFEDYTKLREQMHIPLVIYDGFLRGEGNFVNIEVDHYAGGVAAGEYLKENGHEQVLCISDNNTCMDRLRYQGFLSVLPEAKLMLIPFVQEERTRFYEEKLNEILEYTAVFAVSDYYAIDLLYFLQGHGIEVPRQLSLVGFDNIREAQHTSPPLTTIRQDYTQRAKLAIQMIQKLQEGTVCPGTVSLPVALAARGSVQKIEKCKKQ